MTEEQIKQNAEAYVSNLILSEQEEENYMLAFIDGAHSRDEEVSKLEKALHNVNEWCHQLRNKVYELRHPWISVYDRLPEEIEVENYKNTVNEKYKISKDVFVVDKCGNIGVGCYDHTRKFWLLPYYFRSDAEIVRWMPIPQIEKGE